MAATIVGIHHVKIPVTDLATSRAWYERVFGFRTRWEYADDGGTVRGVAGEIAGIGVGIRENPTAAAGCAGFDPVSFAIADRAAAEAWVAHLDEIGVEHSPIGAGPDGWLLDVLDPDGLAIRLYTNEI